MNINDSEMGYNTRFTVEDGYDKVILESFINDIKASELLKKRVSDAQHKMHEATTELAEIKKSWVYKVWRFIKGK